MRRTVVIRVADLLAAGAQKPFSVDGRLAFGVFSPYLHCTGRGRGQGRGGGLGRGRTWPCAGQAGG